MFHKKSASLEYKSANATGIRSMSNQQLSEEFHKIIIRKFDPNLAGVGP